MTLKEPSSNCVWLVVTPSAVFPSCSVVFPSRSVVFPVQGIFDLVTWSLCPFEIHWCGGCV